MRRVEGALILAAGIAFGACLRLAYESFMYERPGGGHDRYKALMQRIQVHQRQSVRRVYDWHDTPNGSMGNETIAKVTYR